MQKPEPQTILWISLLIFFVWAQGIFLNIMRIMLAMEWGCGQLTIGLHVIGIDYRNSLCLFGDLPFRWLGSNGGFLLTRLAGPLFYLDALLFFAALNYLLIRTILARPSEILLKPGIALLALLLALVEELFLYDEHLGFSLWLENKLEYLLIAAINYAVLRKILPRISIKPASPFRILCIACALATVEGVCFLLYALTPKYFAFLIAIGPSLYAMLALITYALIQKISATRLDWFQSKLGPAVIAFMMALISGGYLHGGTPVYSRNQWDITGGYNWNWLEVKWWHYGDCN